MLDAQLVLCRGCLLLAKRKGPAEQRAALLASAAKAIEMAFRAHDHSRAPYPPPHPHPFHKRRSSGRRHRALTVPLLRARTPACIRCACAGEADPRPQVGPMLQARALPRSPLKVSSLHT